MACAAPERVEVEFCSGPSGVFLLGTLDFFTVFHWYSHPLGHKAVVTCPWTRHGLVSAAQLAELPKSGSCHFAMGPLQRVTVLCLQR